MSPIRKVCVWAVIAIASAAYAQSPAPPAVPAAAIAPSASGGTQTVNPPIDGRQRVHWLLVENIGVGAVLEDVGASAVQTLENSPKEYGTHWSGFGKRVGLGTANYAVKSVMEVGLGSIWGEDPRYFRTDGLSFKSRVAYVMKMTFMARDRSGKIIPAYSRYIAFPASSFLANEWQPTSQGTANEALARVGLGFLSRMGENAWKEFIAPHK